MKKLLCVFSLGVLLFSSLAPSFTYANTDIEEVSSLLNSILEETSNEFQETTSQIKSTPELRTFWIEETGLDEIEYINNNEHFVWNKTAETITVYNNDFSSWVTLKDKNVWATSTDITSEDSYWNYYMRWYFTGYDYSDFNNYNPTWRQIWEQWNCDEWFHIPQFSEFEKPNYRLYQISKWEEIYLYDYLRLPLAWFMNYQWEFQNESVSPAWVHFWQYLVIEQGRTIWPSENSMYLSPWWWDPRWWGVIRCFKDDYLETLSLKVWDATILTQFVHWESFDKTLTWQLLSNIDIPEWYHVEWYITWDNNELTWFDFDNEEITTTMTLIWEVVNDNNWIFDLGNWIRKVVWNNKSIKYDTNLIGWIQWWANASWELYSNDNNAWWWANDDINNQFWAWNNWFWRQWPCQDWWHVASNWEWKTLVNYSCYNNPNCNPKENINDDYWSPIILSNYSNRQSLLWFNIEAWRAIRTSSFISWINFVWIGNNYIEVYDTVVQYYYINYRNTNVNANIPKNAPINVLCIDNYYATITFKNKKDETIIIDSISDIEKDKKINLNQLPEQEEWYTNHYYLKNNGEFEEIENILELIITSDLDIYVESVQNIIPSEPDSVSSPVSHTSGWSGRPISTIKQETKLEQEHNSADTEENKTQEQTATSVTDKSEKKTVEEKIEIIKPKALTRWELAVFSNILTEVFPQLTEWKKNVNEVCNEYTDYKEFSAKEEKAVSKLCRLAIMGIIEDDKTPLETFGINNLSTNEEFIKVVNRMTDKYSEKELKDLKSALSSLENDKEDNLVFWTVYDVFMKVKALFN